MVISTMDNLIVIGLMVIGGLFLWSVGACQTVGIADRSVVNATSDVAETLMSAYNVADDQEQVERYIAIARLKLLAVAENELSDLDKEKLARVEAGLDKILERVSFAPYVRQRSKSLSALVMSIGHYEDASGAVRQVRDVFGGIGEDSNIPANAP